MKKIISFIMLLAFTMNAFAATGNLALLEKQIDDFTYATTVEWDQKDQAFYDQQSQKLIKALKDLKTQGLNQNDVITLLEQKLQDKKALEALKFKISLLPSAATEEDMVKLFSDPKNLYSQGSSWVGAVVAGTIGVALIALVAYGFWWHANYDCVEWQEEYKCYPSRCESSGSGDDRSTDCYGQTCGNFNECVRHEKKEN
jgi:hypothetical protein